MTSNLNINNFNWLVSASNVQSNQSQNLTLDASNALIRLSRNGATNATFDTSFNFTNLPFCSQVPTNNNQLVNKAYLDRVFNDSSYTIDMDVFNQTFKKDTLTSPVSTVIKTNNVTSSIDAPVNQSQVYTFGQSISNIWVAGGTGLNNTLAYSSDGINWNGLGTNIFSSVYGIAWNGSLWVAVGSGTNNIAYSSDGIIWTGITGTNIFSTQGWGVAWNGIRWVAVGEGVNTIAYSSDGINWIGIGASIISSRAFFVGWNGIRWVAGGVGTNTLATSDDGITWVGRGSSIFTSAGRGIAWSGIRWVAVGQGGNTIATSDDGITWVGRGSSIFTGIGRGVAWNGIRWVAVGSGTNNIAYSTDGITWTGLSSSVFTGSFATGSSVTWNGIRWIATGESTNNSIAYSSDGIAWTGLGVSIFSLARGGTSVAFNNARPNTITYPTNLIVAGSQNTNSILYSRDGLTWTGITGTNIFSLSGYGVEWNGKIWVAGGQGTNNTLAYSYDGINWTGLGTTIFTQNCNGIVWGNNKWTAVGYGTGGSDNSIAYSYDGINWIGLGKSIFTGILGARGIAYNGTRWVAVGGQNAPTIGYSNDGINWTPVAGSQSIFGVYGECVAWNGRLWLAGGSRNVSGPNSIAYSYDGINWFGAGNSVITTTCQGLDWNGNMWVAVGSLGANTIAYSYDGLNWNGVGSSFFQTNGATSVKWCGNIWVATGDGGNNTAYSYNGVNWVAGQNLFPTIPRKIGWTSNLGNTYIQQPTIACGEGTNTLAYSPDGIFWNGLGANTFTTRCFHVTWNGTRWIAVGQGTNTIAYSTDGVNWTGLGTSIFSAVGYHVTWNGTVFVAGGEGTNALAYSSDGISWTASSSGNSLFTRVRGIAWNGVSFVAVGANSSDSAGLIAYSSDGITWSQASTTPSSLPRQGYTVAFSNRQWLAGFVGNSIGTNSLLYTTTKNGSSGWQVQGTITTIGSTGGIYGIAYNGVSWILVGENNGVGILNYGLDTSVPPTFSTRTSPFSTRGTDVAWNGVRYVATGQGTNTIAYSFDGSGNWFGGLNNTTVFTTAGNGINGNPGIGGVVVDSQIVLNQNGYGLSNKLDFSSAGYFNNSFTNITINVNPVTLT